MSEQITVLLGSLKTHITVGDKSTPHKDMVVWLMTDPFVKAWMNDQPELCASKTTITFTSTPSKSNV